MLSRNERDNEYRGVDRWHHSCLAVIALLQRFCTPLSDISQGAHCRTGQGKSGVWFLASWNVRTLLDVDGPIETARRQQNDDERVVVDERK